MAGYLKLLCKNYWSLNYGPRAVVVGDNLPAHKIKGISEAIETMRARLIYLSPYSPQFNVIEQWHLLVNN
ncbi:MAG: transposase [Trichodesmium sp. St2_bin6]|nr:transposase [Trichodesmium sp. St4_bin8_1]MDE5078799.1 transposase [Trichodesmium sp. St2_bin6]